MAVKSFISFDHEHEKLSRVDFIKLSSPHIRRNKLDRFFLAKLLKIDGMVESPPLICNTSGLQPYLYYRFGQKSFPGTNTLAYLSTMPGITKKTLITLSPRAYNIKLLRLQLIPHCCKLVCLPLPSLLPKSNIWEQGWGKRELRPLWSCTPRVGSHPCPEILG